MLAGCQQVALRFQIFVIFHPVPGWRRRGGVVGQRRRAGGDVAQADPQSVDLGTDQGQGITPSSLRFQPVYIFKPGFTKVKSWLEARIKYSGLSSELGKVLPVRADHLFKIVVS